MPSKELCTTHTVEATPCGLSISFFVYKNKRQFKEAKGLKELLLLNSCFYYLTSHLYEVGQNKHCHVVLSD